MNTINILNADQLYVEGKRIQQLDLEHLLKQMIIMVWVSIIHFET